jgi:hypothetical protein
MDLTQYLPGLRTRVGFGVVSAICLDSMYICAVQVRLYLPGSDASLGRFVLTNRLMTFVVACCVFLWPAGIWARARVLGAPRLWSTVWLVVAALLWCIVLAVPRYRLAAFVVLLATQIPLAVVKRVGEKGRKGTRKGDRRIF